MQSVERLRHAYDRGTRPTNQEAALAGSPQVNRGRLFLILCVLSYSGAAQNRDPAASVLTVDADGIGYSHDNADRSRLATAPGPTIAAPAANFDEFVSLWDVVAINGK